jgi:hypothetical protein
MPNLRPFGELIVLLTRNSAERAWIDLTKRDGNISADEAAATFSALKPVDASFMTRGAGEWQGADLNTGHPTRNKMMELNWAGKTFRSAEDVDPIVVYDGNGQRKWNSDWGHARVSLSFARVGILRTDESEAARNGI